MNIGNEWGQVVVDLNMRTSIEGLFAVGDMRIEAPKQVVSAAGDGAVSALQSLFFPIINREMVFSKISNLL